MPPEDILIDIRANTADAADGIDSITRLLNKLENSINQVDNAEVARSRRLEANARAREAKYNTEVTAIQKVIAQINQARDADTNRSNRLIANANARKAKVEGESKAKIALERRLQAEIQKTANEQKAKDSLSIQLSRERQQKQRTELKLYEKQIAAINDKHRAEDRALKRFQQGEMTKRAEIKKTTDAANAAARKELEAIREVNRAKARQFRREERVASERFQRAQGGFGAAALGAGAGANIGQKLQTIIGQAATIAGGLYVVQAGLGAVIRDRARVQRLEVGVRDLTDTFRAQAVLPRLQEIALLPGLDYVTATQAFTRALSGGFTDQQSLRLIDQIRNAVALSQGSIEDTNEVLRQFIQIQARDRFDQENLRPILERAPFIRRVIQAEFGTQIGGEIQQVLEQRGLSTTEGILRIVEGLAAGPVADPTTLQNALDNVRNELILLNNELGRRIQPALTALVDGFTETLRFLQGGPGAILSGVLTGGTLLGTAGFGLDLLRSRRAYPDILKRVGHQKLSQQLTPSFFRHKTPFANRLISDLGLEGVTGGFIGHMLSTPEKAKDTLLELNNRLAFRQGYMYDLRERAKRRGIDVSQIPDNEFARRAARRYPLTDAQRFAQEAFFLDEHGEVMRGRRFASSILGRGGRFQNPFGGPGSF